MELKDVIPEILTQESIKEIIVFRRFVLAKARYGMKAMSRRKFWRAYMGLEEGKGWRKN